MAQGREEMGPRAADGGSPADGAGSVTAEVFSGEAGLARLGSRFAVTCTAPDPAAWSATFLRADFGRTALSVMDTEPYTNTRTPAQARSGSGRVYLTFSLDAEVSLRMAGQWALRRPGVPTVARSDRPFLVRTEHRDRQVTLSTLLSELGTAQGFLPRVVGRPMPLTPLTRSTVSFLRTLAGQLGRPEVDPDEVDGTLVEMLRALVREAGRPEADRHDRESAERRRIREFVAVHLSDPDLRVEALADHLGVSVRYVHRLFEAEDISAAQIIREARMERAVAVLADVRTPRPSLAEVARQVGFHGRDQFARAFRARFGVSPREWVPAANAG